MQARTRWAEEFVEHVASLPLCPRMGFPRALSAGSRPRERGLRPYPFLARRCHPRPGTKCQEDPDSFTDTKRNAWVRKSAKGALSQIKGALRGLANDEIWCDHPRRGRVSFNAGELLPVHGLVLVENQGGRVTLRSDFPAAHKGAPISYFSVNDFQNVINELRAFPEIVAHPRARQSLPQEATQAIGGEDVIFLYYLLHERTFDGFDHIRGSRPRGKLHTRSPICAYWPPATVRTEPFCLKELRMHLQPEPKTTWKACRLIWQEDLIHPRKGRTTCECKRTSATSALVDANFLA